MAGPRDTVPPMTIDGLVDDVGPVPAGVRGAVTEFAAAG